MASKSPAGKTTASTTPKKTTKKVTKAKSAKSQTAAKSKIAALKAAGKSLVIVESPAKARTVGQILGNKYVVAASQGHVRDLPKGQLGVDVDQEFEPSYVVMKDKQKLLNLSLIHI